MYFNEFKPRLIAIELTSKCNLLCKHCRGSSISETQKVEFTKLEAFNLLDQISAFGSPIVILTGGEPLLVQWIFDLIAYGTSKGLKMTLASNGTLITKNVAFKLKKAGIKRVSISLDGTKDIHDNFRCVSGCFDLALHGIQNLREENVEFQINTTVSKFNMLYLNEIHDFVNEIGSVAHHFFFLVTTGRANDLNKYELSPSEYEKILIWLFEKSKKNKINIHPTCAPQYFRIRSLSNFTKDKKNLKRQVQNFNGMDSLSKGCLCGISFLFISSIGEVNPCGYLPISCGNIKEKTLQEIWTNSIILNNIRNPNNYHGKCGKCEFKYVCGGCRARAYATNGDYLGEEPFCLYTPKKTNYI